MTKSRKNSRDIMSQNTPTADGVQVDLISSSKMETLGPAEKIEMIIEGVQDGKIVILETGLTPDEEGQLIERTMGAIEPEEFNGIEIETYPTGEQSAGGGFVNRLLGREDTNNLTVIGPADRINTLHKDESLISTLITRK